MRLYVLLSPQALAWSRHREAHGTATACSELSAVPGRWKARTVDKRLSIVKSSFVTRAGLHMYGRATRTCGSGSGRELDASE